MQCVWEKLDCVLYSTGVLSCVAALRCYTCNNCGSSSSLSSEDCANTANTINSLYESLGISDGSNEPSNYCYTMTMGSTGKVLNITIETNHLTFDSLTLFRLYGLFFLPLSSVWALNVKKYSKWFRLPNKVL